MYIKNTNAHKPMIHEEALTFVETLFEGVYMSRRKKDLRDFLIYLVNVKYGKSVRIIRQINRDFLMKWKFYADLIAQIIPIKPSIKRGDLNTVVTANTVNVFTDTSISDRMIQDYKDKLAVEIEFRKQRPHVIIEKYKSNVSYTKLQDEKEFRQNQRKKRIAENLKNKCLINKFNPESNEEVCAVGFVKLLIDKRDDTNTKAIIRYSDNVDREIAVMPTTKYCLPSAMQNDTLPDDFFYVIQDSFIIKSLDSKNFFIGPYKYYLKNDKPKPVKETHTLLKIINKQGLLATCVDTEAKEYKERIKIISDIQGSSKYPIYTDGFTVEDGLALFILPGGKKPARLASLTYHEKETNERKIGDDLEFISSGEEALPLYYETVETKTIQMPNTPINKHHLNKWEKVKAQCQKPRIIKNEIITYNKFELLTDFQFENKMEAIYNPVVKNNKLQNSIPKLPHVRKRAAKNKELRTKELSNVVITKELSLNNLVMNTLLPKKLCSYNCLIKVREDGYLTKSMLPLTKSKRKKIVSQIKGLLEYKDEMEFNDEKNKAIGESYSERISSDDLT